MVEYKLTGTLVIETVNRQLATLAKLIGSSKQVQLDLAEIRIIDSAGIALLIEIKQLAQQKQCHLTLINPTEQIQRFCQLYKLTL